jgi:hypothetical protein
MEFKFLVGTVAACLYQLFFLQRSLNKFAWQEKVAMIHPHTHHLRPYL